MKINQDTKLMIIYFLCIVFVIVIWLNWNKYPTISKHDYINQSPEVLVKRLLSITPIGTLSDQVKVAIDKHLNRECTLIKMSGFGPNAKKGFGFKEIPGENDYMFKCKLTSYGWAKNFFCAGNVVDGMWLFDENQRLKEVAVRRWSDGM